VAIKGSLKEASLADVCQLLAMGRKTGCLSVTDRSRFGQIYFDRGRITHATIVNRRDRLGDLLIRDGVLRPDELRAAIDRQGVESDRRLGELLVEEGVLSRSRLEEYIRHQAEEAVYTLFTWTQGSFYFEVDQYPDEGEVLLSINPESLLLEGARRVDEWGLIEKKIPTFDLLFEVEADRVREAGVELTSEQERILPLLDGTRTIQELIDETGLGEFAVGKALYGLIQAGFAHRVGRRQKSPGNARHAEVQEHRNLGVAFYRAGLLTEAVREFRRVLEFQPGDAHASFHLALIAVRKGEDRDAVRLFQRLIESVGPSRGAFVNLAYVLERLGRTDEAWLVLDEIERRWPGTAVVSLSKGVLRLEAGDFAAAEEHLAEYRERLGAGESPSAPYYYYAALAAAIGGRTADADALVAEGLGAYPSCAPLHLLAGGIAERRGDYATAEECYRRAVEEDADLAHAHKGLGDVAYREKRFAEALEHYERAVKLAPELGDDVYTRLGNLYYERKDRSLALEHWRRALALNPDNHMVRNNIEVVTHVFG